MEVIPGTFKLRNQQADRAVVITADLAGLTAGRAGAPVRGSGIFVGGGGNAGGRLVACRLETGASIATAKSHQVRRTASQAACLSLRAFFVDSVRNHGPVTTYGPNDVVL